MAPVQPVTPVKQLVAVLWSNESTLHEALEELRSHWGPLDFQGRDVAFDLTDYYQAEMGSRLMRRLITFEQLIPPENIRTAKLVCNAVEETLSEKGTGGIDLRSVNLRRVNLDVGYLDHNKLVLASLKYAGQKIHLGDGVYADLIARYEAGRYQPFPWTFPDFKDGRFDDELLAIRGTYLAQLKRLRRVE